MDNLICYCFEYTESDIEADIIKHGKSAIEERIQEEKKAGGCQCKTKNPKGIWCLGDVHRVVDKVFEKEGIKIAPDRRVAYWFQESFYEERQEWSLDLLLINLRIPIEKDGMDEYAKAAATIKKHTKIINRSGKE